VKEKFEIKLFLTDSNLRQKIKSFKFSTPSCCQRVLKSIEERTIIKFDVFQRSVRHHISLKERPQKVIYVVWRGSNHNMKN
jgi:hypothetical protein